MKKDLLGAIRRQVDDEHAKALTAVRVLEEYLKLSGAPAPVLPEFAALANQEKRATKAGEGQAKLAIAAALLEDCWTTVKELAGQMVLSDAQVRWVLQGLQRAGVLERRQRHSNGCYEYHCRRNGQDEVSPAALSATIAK